VQARAPLAPRPSRPCELASALTVAQLLASRTTLQRAQPGTLPKLQRHAPSRQAITPIVASTPARAGPAGRRRRCLPRCAQTRRRPRPQGGAPRARVRALAAPPAAPPTRSQRWRRRPRPPRGASRRSCTHEAVSPSGHGAVLLDLFRTNCVLLSALHGSELVFAGTRLLHAGFPCAVQRPQWTSLVSQELLSVR